MSIWSRIFLCIRKKYLKQKIPICNCLNFEKKTLTAQNSATKWLHQKIFSAKIFAVKNYTMSEIFRLIASFYRVADFLLGRPTFMIYGISKKKFCLDSKLNKFYFLSYELYKIKHILIKNDKYSSR